MCIVLLLNLGNHKWFVTFNCSNNISMLALLYIDFISIVDWYRFWSWYQCRDSGGGAPGCCHSDSDTEMS